MATNIDFLPEGVFDSFDALFGSVQEQGRLAGCAYVIGKSDIKKGRRVKVITCKRSGKERPRINNEEYRQRNRFTFKCQCPFSVKARERSDGSWTLQHRGPEFSTHNHDPAPIGTFPEHRRLNAAQIQVVQSHYTAGIPASRTVAVLRQDDPQLHLYHRDIYNITAELSRAKREGKAPPEALISRLEAEKAEGKIFFEWRCDSNGHISMLFIADARSVEYLNRHPDVLLLDCTYKTNKFDMPLLDILGVDHHNNSFTVALCFLDQEITENYMEAVQHLKALFEPGIWPSVIATDCEPALISAVSTHFPAIHTKRVLCYWHVSKCVLSNCKALFGTMERWEEYSQFFQKVVFSKTEDEYEDRLEEFKTEFNWNNGNPHVPLAPSLTPDQIQDITTRDLERQALEYTLGQWLTPFKTEIVHAWTDRHFHRGTTTTSRLEGAHSVLKRWIGSSCKDLTRVWEATKLAIEDQINEIKTTNAQKNSSNPIGLSGQFFSQIKGKITHSGLYLLQKQLEHVKRQREHEEAGEISAICIRSFCISMGMPCWHIIKERLAAGQAIVPVDFHPHWHIQRPLPGFEYVPPPPIILDPISRQRRRTAEAERRAHERANNRLRTA